MQSLFIQILNMSITGSIIILFVLAARLILRKAPKIYSYLLWLIPFFRLICPFSIESIYSLIPVNSQPIPQDITYMAQPMVNTNSKNLNKAINQYLPSAISGAEINPLHIIFYILAVIWLCGVIALIFYSVRQRNKLEENLTTCIIRGKRLYSCADIEIPFVMGILKPRIYLPESLLSSDNGYILLHEKTHIRRFDYLIKFIAYIALILHWFNPLVHIAYRLMAKDMEMSCDETVIAKSDGNIKKEYSTALLNISKGKQIHTCPPAFAESNIKKRIKNILSYKKPHFTVSVLSFGVVALFCMACFANQPESPVILKLPESVDKVELEINFANIIDKKTVTAAEINGWIETLNIKKWDSYFHLACEYDAIFTITSGDFKYVIYGYTGDKNDINYLSVSNGNTNEVYEIHDKDVYSLCEIYNSNTTGSVKYNTAFNGKWKITDYCGIATEPYTADINNISNDKIEYFNSIFIGKQIDINDSTVLWVSPPSELGFEYDQLTGFYGTSVIFPELNFDGKIRYENICIKGIENYETDIISDMRDNTYLWINSIYFYRLEKIS